MSNISDEFAIPYNVRTSYDVFCQNDEQQTGVSTDFCHAASTSVCCCQTASSEVAVWWLLFVMVRDRLVFFSGDDGSAGTNILWRGGRNKQFNKQDIGETDTFTPIPLLLLPEWMTDAR